MMALHSIVYVSTAAWPMSEEDLRVLLNASLARNLREHITGVLLYASGHFIQCIEGPTGPLQALFASIQVDQRHRDILLLVDEPIETRDFAAWTMGYAPLEAGSFGQLLTASWPAREADTHPAGRSKGKQLLQIVWGQIASGVAFR